MLFINYGKEVQKLLYQDGFDKSKNHSVWKLKVQLDKVEWNSVKEYFNYYDKDDKFLSNMHYYGWGTTQPVNVVKVLFSLRN